MASSTQLIWPLAILLVSVHHSCTRGPNMYMYSLQNPKQPFSWAEDCYRGRGENSRAVFTVIDHITQTLHYSNARPRFQPYWASSGASGVQNAYMQGHIYTGTTWRVTSSVPTQYRCYMYSSVADLMAAGSWQLTPVSQSPTCPFRAMRLCWPLLCVTSIVSINLPG